MPDVFPDYFAIMRQADEDREIIIVRWGMPSFRKALMEAAQKRAETLKRKASRSISTNCCVCSRIRAQPTTEIRQQLALEALARSREPSTGAVHELGQLFNQSQDRPTPRRIRRTRLIEN
jgi:hypothetical protein